MNNISFTSAILVRGSKKQINQIEDRLYDQSIGTAQRNWICAAKGSIPSPEHSDTIEATKQMNVTGLCEINLPKEAFPVSVRELKKGTTDVDSLYLIATNESAISLDNLEKYESEHLRNLQAGRLEFSKTHDKNLINELIDKLATLEKNCRVMGERFARLIELHSHTLIDANSVIKAIKENQFDFQDLKVLRK